MCVLPLPTALLPSPPHPTPVPYCELRGSGPGVIQAWEPGSSHLGLVLVRASAGRFFGPCQFALSPAGDVEESLLFIPLALKMFGAENKPSCAPSVGFPRRECVVRTDRWEGVGEGSHRQSSCCCFLTALNSRRVGRDPGCFTEKDCQKQLLLGDPLQKSENEGRSLSDSRGPVVTSALRWL